MTQLFIKNWRKFQHYKDRNPPWIKLHSSILNDFRIFGLDDKSFRVLVLLWLVVSGTDGELPSFKDVAFILRMKEREIIDICRRLLEAGLLEGEIDAKCSDATNTVADATNTVTRGEERRGETEERQTREGAFALKREDAFETFWQAYPKKKGKLSAKKAFDKAVKSVHIESMLSAIERQKQSRDWLKDGGQYIPLPASWLNQGRWDDETDVVSQKEEIKYDIL